MILKDGVELVGARCRKNGSPIRIADAGDGTLWAFGFEHGLARVVRARSFEDAFDAAIDSLAHLDAAELPEAYGFDGDDGQERFDAACADAACAASEDGVEFPELVEGYRATSDGNVVNEGHYAWLRPLTAEDARETVRLVLREFDDMPNVDVEFTCEGSYDYVLEVKRDGERVGRPKRFRAFDLLADVGRRLKRLDRAFGSVTATIQWGKWSDLLDPTVTNS